MLTTLITSMVLCGALEGTPVYGCEEVMSVAERGCAFTAARDVLVIPAAALRYSRLLVVCSGTWHCFNCQGDRCDCLYGAYFSLPEVIVLFRHQPSDPVGLTLVHELVHWAQEHAGFEGPASHVMPWFDAADRPCRVESGSACGAAQQKYRECIATKGEER